MNNSSQSREWKRRGRWAAVLVGVALFGGAPRMAVAQPRASPHAAELAEAARLSAEGEKLEQDDKYDAALPLAERALALLEKALGPDHLDVAQSLHNLARMYAQKADYAHAEALLQRALALREKALGPDHPDVASSLNNLGLVYYRKGEYARAETLHQRALAIREKALGPDHPDVAKSLNNLGIVLANAKGEYARAEALHQRALAIGEKAFGPNHPEVARSLNNVALVYTARGEYTRAKALLQRTLAIWERALGSDHPAVANALDNLALVYAIERDYARAEALNQRALAIREKVFGPDHPLVALSLNNLAGVYRDKGDYARAEALHKRALSISEKALGPDHPEVASTLHDLANLYRLKGEYARAETLARRALAIREKGLGPDHPEVAESLQCLAALAEATEGYPLSLSFAQRAAEIREKTLTLIVATGAEAQKRDYLAKIAEDLDHDLWRAVSTGDRKATELALNTLLHRKGRALDAMADSMRVLRGRLGSEAEKLFDELLSVRSQRSTLTLRGPGPLERKPYRELLDGLEAQDEKLEAQISQRSAVFRAEVQPITVLAVKRSLPQSSALVEWSVYRPFNPKAHTTQESYAPARYAACMLPHHGEASCVDLGEIAPINTAVTRLRRALSRPSHPHVQELARDLDARVMAPVRRLLGETRWVFLSPDGALNLIPFAALVDENGRYLIETYAFTYVTSGRDLLRLATASPEPREEATVVASPDFDARGPDVPVGDAKPEDGRGILSHSFSGLTFPLLPATVSEARKVGAAVGPTRVLLNADATERAVKALHGPSVLHIATHGFFLPDQPASRDKPSSPPRSAIEDPLLRSGLALAGANLRSSGGDDGLLTALEMSSEDLYGTRLVVLSACETGLGDVINGDGVYGLRRALVLAGARTQVMSLWKVDDSATQELMIAYYSKLRRGIGRSEAMRQVQLSMLEQPDRSRPYYWASFIVSGDWTSLSGKPSVPELGRVQPGPRGCACALAAAPSPAGAAWTALAALALALARRQARSGRRKAGSASLCQRAAR